MRPTQTGCFAVSPSSDRAMLLDHSGAQSRPHNEVNVASVLRRRVSRGVATGVGAVALCDRRFPAPQVERGLARASRCRQSGHRDDSERAPPAAADYPWGSSRGRTRRPVVVRLARRLEVAHAHEYAPLEPAVATRADNGRVPAVTTQRHELDVDQHGEPLAAACRNRADLRADERGWPESA